MRHDAVAIRADAGNAAEHLLHLQLVDALGLGSLPVGAHLVQNTLHLCRGVGVDAGSIQSAVIVDAIDGPQGLTAIVLSQRLFILCILWFPISSDYIFTQTVGAGHSCRAYWSPSSLVSR